MKRSTRYLFIGIGLLVFFILTPLIVLYISGTRFNPDNNRYEQTGIFNAVSEPNNATLSVNGESRDNTPATVRFLDAGEYEFTLSKTGYFDWSKRLEIKSAKVTYATNGTNAVYLLKRDEQPLIIAENITDFTTAGSDIFYLKSDKLITAPLKNLSDTTIITLPFAATGLMPSSNARYVLAFASKRAVWIDRDTKRVVEITAFVPDRAIAEVIDNGSLAVLSYENNLVFYDPRTGQAGTALSNIKGFTALGNTIYYAQTTPPETIIKTAQLGGHILRDDQTLYRGAPLTEDLGLYITERKELFLSSLNTLYRVGEKLDQIASGVRTINFEQKVPSLAFTTDTEQWYYDFSGSHANLYTRSTAGVELPVVRNSIGYAFFFNNSNLQALELDNRDRQNSYFLTEVTSPQKLRLDSDGKNAYILDGGVLKSLELR